MAGLFIRYRDEGSCYMSFAKPAIRLGTDQGCDLVLRGVRGIIEEHCVLTYSADAWRVEAFAEILVDGRPLAAGAWARVEDGATLALGEYMVDLAFDRAARWRVTLDAKERELLAAIAANDHASREIYADWLEEQDQRDKAAYIRGQLRAFGAGGDELASELAFEEARGPLRHLAERLDPRWRRALAQVRIENCSREPDAPCPVDWAALDTTTEPSVRRCRACDTSVYYCASVDKARYHASRDRRVVVDVVEPRRPHDLSEAQMRGRMVRLRR